jgi:hypothetical protein
MENDNNNLAEGIEAEEDCEPAFDIWTDEGARRYNEMIGEGSAYLAANPFSIENYEEDFDGEECEYRDPEMHDSEEETLSPGNLEMILENSCIF